MDYALHVIASESGGGGPLKREERSKEKTEATLILSVGLAMAAEMAPAVAAVVTF